MRCKHMRLVFLFSVVFLLCMSVLFYISGASSLHLAIAYSNNELVQDLVEAGADVSQKAIGINYLLFASTVFKALLY